MSVRYIMGRNCIREIVKNRPEVLKTIFTLTDDLYNEFAQHFSSVQKVSKKALESMCDTESHQGVVASLSLSLNAPINILDREDESLTVLIIDGVEDPQNFGSIIRAAECFGVDGIIYSRNRGVDLTPVAAKASTGACALVPLIEVSNLDQAIRSLQEWGFFVYLAENDQSAIDYKKVDYAEKRAFVVGSEGKGTKQLLKKRADVLIKIPMLGVINSLNVAQATAVVLAQATGE